MRAYQQVEATLRARLSDGTLRAGTVLLEGPLATLLGTSRTPVRQALERLRDEGLLSAFHGRGLVVGDGRDPVRRVDLVGTLHEDAGLGVRRAWAWQRGYDQVERALVHLAVLGRFRVSELALADDLGIGRTVARDILLRIAASGVIEKTEKAHWVTVPLDDARVRDLYALRSLLEGAAIAEAAARLPADLPRTMSDRLARVARRYPETAPGDLDRLETDLHVTCIGHVGNKEILAALLRTRCIILSSKHILGADARLPADDPFLAEHADVLEALAARNGERAARAMVAHLRSASEKVVRRLQVFRAGCPDPSASFATRLPDP